MLRYLKGWKVLNYHYMIYMRVFQVDLWIKIDFRVQEAKKAYGTRST